MLRADEDGQMRIISNAKGIEKSDIYLQKCLNSFNSITRSICCNVRLNIMMKG